MTASTEQRLTEPYKLWENYFIFYSETLNHLKSNMAGIFLELPYGNLCTYFGREQSLYFFYQKLKESHNCRKTFKTTQ